MLSRSAPGVWVALGGGVGAGMRATLDAWAVTSAFDPRWMTLLINIAGSAVLGVVYGLLPDTSSHVVPGGPPAEAGLPAHVRTRAFLTAGLCGGFTTFSAFGAWTLELVRMGNIAEASLYAGTSVVACIIGVVAGIAAGSAIRTAQQV